MELLERGSVLAKQVLSQLSYTPTVEGPFILKHLPLFRIPILRKIVITDVPNGAFSSFACRSSFWRASLFICNFMCEYFLKT